MKKIPESVLPIDWASMVPRYLVPINPGRMMHYFSDVLIIGGGLAGLRAAHEIDPALQTVVVTKDKLEESNSAYAQGGSRVFGIRKIASTITFRTRLPRAARFVIPTSFRWSSAKLRLACKS